MPGKGGKSFGLTSNIFPVTVFHGADSAAASDKSDAKAANPQGDQKPHNVSIDLSEFFHLINVLFFTKGALRKIFMPEADASSFFKRRSRRAVKTQDEINGEVICAYLKTLANSSETP